MTGLGSVLILLVGLLETTDSAETPKQTLDPGAVEAFVDEHFETGLAETGVPGAVVAIVQHQRTLLLKGYGTADVETGTVVDPERTLYRLGSITKPMTAIAVLKLAEEGKIDLDEDVGAFLGRSAIPHRHPEPITARQLLTHRGGLDADLSFSVVERPGATQRLSGDAIQRRLYRVRPPGAVASYDVLGYGVLALVLEDVTGLGFDQAIREAVFVPAGMDHAVIGLPADRLDDFARCHISTQPGDARICDQAALSELYQGSGSAGATAADMAAFMKALLRQTAGADAGLLSPEAFAEFLDFDQYRFHPAGRGLGLGIQELEVAGRTAFGHGGAIQGFRNEMDLFPQYGLGIYYGVNGGAEQVYDARLSMLPRLLSGGAPAEVRRAHARLRSFTSRFAEEFLPEATHGPDPPTLATDAFPPAELAGFYLHSRFVSDNVLLNLSRLSLATEVASEGESIRVDGNGPYTQVQPGFFEDPEGKTVAFRRNEHGTWVAFGGDPLGAYQRVPWYARPVFSVLPLLPSLILLLTSVVYLFPRFAGERRRAAVLWTAGGSLFLLGFVLELEYGVYLREVKGYALPPLLWRAGLWVAALALVAAPIIASAWRWSSASHAAIRWAQRAHGVLIGLAGLYVVVFSLYWGLLV